MKLLIVLFFCGYSWATPKRVPSIPHCSNQQYFQNLINRDSSLKKGSVHTFSKTGQGDFWFWHEQKMLLNPGLPAVADACLNPRMIINRELTLKDGILPPGKDPGGSTYLVTHEWAMNAIYQAVMYGETIRAQKP